MHGEGLFSVEGECVSLTRLRIAYVAPHSYSTNADFLRTFVRVA